MIFSYKSNPILNGKMFATLHNVAEETSKYSTSGHINWGTWVAQSGKRPTSTQVMISLFVSLSPMSGSVLTARSVEPALDSVSPPLSAPPLLMLCVSLSLK